MRIKISFLKAQSNNGLLPLHHQLLLSEFLEEIIDEMKTTPALYCFSSLKGTSKVLNGQIRFLSSKVSLVITSPRKEFLEALAKNIFQKGLINLGKLAIAPKSYQIISDPNFETVMKYVCIAPVVAATHASGGDEAPLPIDPTSQEFSDLIFDSLISRMEQAGFTGDELNNFAEFEITPDPSYMERIQSNPKKYARYYRNKKGDSMYGYLLPFSIHAHPRVHQFIWESGLGLFTAQGYGMLDVVPESPPASEPIVP